MTSQALPFTSAKRSATRSRGIANSARQPWTAHGDGIYRRLDHRHRQDITPSAISAHELAGQLTGEQDAVQPPRPMHPDGWCASVVAALWCVRCQPGSEYEPPCRRVAQLRSPALGLIRRPECLVTTRWSVEEAREPIPRCRRSPPWASPDTSDQGFRRLTCSIRADRRLLCVHASLRLCRPTVVPGLSNDGTAIPYDLLNIPTFPQVRRDESPPLDGHVRRRRRSRYCGLSWSHGDALSRTRTRCSVVASELLNRAGSRTSVTRVIDTWGEVAHHGEPMCL